MNHHCCCGIFDITSFICQYLRNVRIGLLSAQEPILLVVDWRARFSRSLVARRTRNLESGGSFTLVFARVSKSNPMDPRSVSVYFHQDSCDIVDVLAVEVADRDLLWGSTVVVELVGVIDELGNVGVLRDVVENIIMWLAGVWVGFPRSILTALGIDPVIAQRPRAVETIKAKAAAPTASAFSGPKPILTRFSAASCKAVSDSTHAVSVCRFLRLPPHAF